jgi:hypothetical protein
MAGVRVGLGSEKLMEECSDLPGVVQHASVYVWFGATSTENYMSHKIIVPGGLFSSSSNTAGGRTLVDQIDGNFSGEERDCAEHAVLELVRHLPPNVTSNTQCRRFSIDQCRRIAAICRSSSLGKLERKYRFSAVTRPSGLIIRIDSTARMLRTPGHSARTFSSVGTGCTNTRRRVR